MVGVNLLSAVLLCWLPLCVTVEVVVGPIIGRVTPNSARILVEVDTSMQLVVQLSTSDNTVVAQQQRSTEPNLAFIFPFTNLQPRTRYRVNIVGITLGFTSQFTTLPLNPTLADNLRFAFIACNRIWYTQNEVPKTGDDVWSFYQDRVLNYNDPNQRIDYAFHLGDQYYSDDWGPQNNNNEWTQSLNLLRDKSADQWPSFRAQIKSIYQNGYRNTFRHAPTRVAMANVPNIMIGDDHELVDDVGDVASHNNPNSPEYFVIHVVKDLFYMYEWQLYEDVPDVHNPSGVPQVLRENRGQWSWGEYGFLLIDSRYAKYFQPTPAATPYLTSPQWQEIDGYLAVNGSSQNVRLLTVMAQIPIVLFDQRVIESSVALSEQANDLEGTWEFGDHQREQVRLLEALRGWIGRNVAARAVTLVGGDMHLGGYSIIEYDEKPIMQQLVTGPVSGDQLGSVAQTVLNAVNELFDNVDDEWEFEHYKWRPRRNIGLLSTNISDTKYLAAVSHIMSLTRDNNGTTTNEVIITLPEEDHFFPISGAGQHHVSTLVMGSLLVFWVVYIVSM